MFQIPDYEGFLQRAEEAMADAAVGWRCNKPPGGIRYTSFILFNNVQDFKTTLL